MSSRYKAALSYIPHFITCTVIRWIDALSREEYKDIVLQSLNYCISNKGLQMHAWVIMPNHLHLIVSTNDQATLAGVVRDFKKFTSRMLIAAIADNPSESRKEWMLQAFSYAGRNIKGNKEYQFWQHDYHPVELSTADMWEQRLEYLHQNPVKAGIVWEAPAYKYSSACDYYDGKPGLLPLVML